MPALQVRDFPEELYVALRARAQQEHRSIAQQTIIAVQEHLSGPKTQTKRVKEESEREERIEKRKRLFAEIDALPRFEVPDDFPTPEQIVRELRDSR